MKNPLFQNSIFLGLFMLCGFLQAQSVSGTVSDETGPLPGASVVVKGTTTGTQTDFDGNFTLNNIGEDAVLSISYVGYMAQEIPVEGQSTIEVTLQQDAQALDEVVVVAYGTSTKKDLTGAVGIIQSDEITSFPNTSVDQAIQGKTAGVQVTQDSGAPGASVSVNIRGVGSFGNTTPLYVIDGFPTQDISFLNPNDIASISVLKDASAAALYGVRASNGVVIIETKGGTSDKLIVSVDSWTGVRLAPKGIDVLDAQQFATLANDLGAAQDKAVLPEWSNPSALRSIDWQDYAFSTAFRTGHNISVRGGGEKLRAAFTAGLLDEDGVVLASSYKRYNVGVNLDADLSDKLRLKTDIKYAYNEKFQNLGAGYFNLLKVFANVPYLDDRTGTNLPYDGNGNYGAFTDSELIAPSSNTLAGALRPDNDNGENVVLGNFSMEYDFLPNLTAKGNLGFKSQNYAGWSFNPTYNNGGLDNNARASYSISQNTSNEYIAEGILQYKNEFGNHKVDVLAGLSAQRTKYKNIFVNSQGFLNNSIRDHSQAAEVIDRRGTWGTSTLASTFARFNYSYDSRYYLTATVRRDGNGDHFGANNLYGIFPSFALSWNIDEEAFMEDSFFDVLKLRGSWGETGSFLGIDAFQFLANYNNGSTTNDAGYVLGGTPVQGLQPVSLSNPDLKWETQIQTNIGLEAEFLNNRLYVTADWFNKESSDFLFQQAIPSQTGFTTKSVNGGNVSNKGLELLVGYRKFDGDFTWDVSANFTAIKNNITELVGTTEYYKYCQIAEVLDWAMELFQLVETYAFDLEFEGYTEAFAENWDAIDDMRLSEKDLNAPKTMNTHLHILEAYTTLYEVNPKTEVRQALENLIRLFLDKFASANQHFKLFFSRDWQNLSSEASYGHDIEAVWLLVHAARTIKDVHLTQKTEALAVTVADTFIKEALDEDFGVFNAIDLKTGNLDADKHWWPQAEAVIGLLYVSKITRDESYGSIAKKIWQFTMDTIIDTKNGEWFFRVDRQGSPYTDENKLGPWKAPYHNSRACMEIIKLLD